MFAFVTRIASTKLTVAAASALMLVGTTVAQAHRHDEHRFFGIDLGVPVVVAPTPVVPVYEDREVQVLVPAVYRTVVDRVWREPEYRTTLERVAVPAQFEVRAVRRTDGYRVWYRNERVLIAPAHFEERERPVIVCAGHFEDISRQELVSDAHYETRFQRVVVAEQPSPQPVVVVPQVDIRLGR